MHNNSTSLCQPGVNEAKINMLSVQTSTNMLMEFFYQGKLHPIMVNGTKSDKMTEMKENWHVDKLH